MEKSRAIEIAEKFLREHHDYVVFVNASLKGGSWFVTFSVQNIQKRTKTVTVKVNAKTGEITGYLL